MALAQPRWSQLKKIAHCRCRSRSSGYTECRRKPLAQFLGTHGSPACSSARRWRRKSGPATQLQPAKAETLGAPATAGGNRRRYPNGPRSTAPCTRRSSLSSGSSTGSRGRFAARTVPSIPRPAYLDAIRAELTGLSLALGPADACYFSTGPRGSDMFAERPVQIDIAAALSALKPLLESEAVLKVGQNVEVRHQRVCPQRHRRSAGRRYDW